MKISGNKIMMIVSAVILGSTLIVPVLPAESYFLNNNSNLNEKNIIEFDEMFDTSNVSVDFSIGRELSIRL